MGFDDVLEHAGGHVEGMIKGDAPNSPRNERSALSVENSYTKAKGGSTYRTMKDREEPAKPTGKSIFREFNL
jgi:hypothetical protein